MSTFSFLLCANGTQSRYQMSRVNLFVRTLFISNLVGLVTVGLALSADWAGTVSAQTAVSLLLFSSLTSTLVALLGCTLRRSFSQRERLALSILLSLALAAANVLTSDVASGNATRSLLPLAIYAIALLNSLIIAPLSTAVTNYFAMELS